jgi:NAD(P)-dependent dehydrogenase (short-subunit alcohol dehydrogenase family)
MKNFVIIGGNRGIGERIVSGLLQKEHSVYHFSRFSTEEPKDLGSLYHPTKFDATKDEFNEVLPESIDGYVYLPGSINLRPFERYSMEEFMADININLLGNVKILQKLMPSLKKNGAASCVFFSTVAVGQGLPFHASIASAKGAIEGLTKTLAAEYAPKVRVNCIAPGLTETTLSEKITSNPKMKEASEKKHPMMRIGKPEDIAEMALFLLEEKSSWMTGQILSIDGGMSSIKK